MERMDYWDRVFDPAARQGGQAARSGEPTPRPSPLFAMDMMLRLAEHAAAVERSRQTDAVRAMEPIPSPGDYAAPDRGHQPGSVVAMEPVPNPRDRAAATDRNAVRSASVRAAEPRPDPAPSPEGDAEDRTRSLVRQNPWLTRFWMELTPEQRARVERQLHRGNVRLASREQADPAAAWDPMGLSDRASLVFGRGPSFQRPAPAETPNRSTWAGSS